MIRRYSTPKKSRGTVIPPALRIEVLTADQGCAGPGVGMPRECLGAIELDHIRASHGTGMKSDTVRSNLISLCGEHHRQKTESGKKWRPRLLEHVAWREFHKQETA